MKFIFHRFPSFFKRTLPLIHSNIWQCLLTLLPLQSWTDFRRFTTFFLQEFDYNALFHANVYLRFAHLPHNCPRFVLGTELKATLCVYSLGCLIDVTPMLVFPVCICIETCRSTYDI
jgi:hypothetical protein